MPAPQVHNSTSFQKPVMPITMKLCVPAGKVAKEAGIRTHVFDIEEYFDIEKLQGISNVEKGRVILHLTFFFLAITTISPLHTIDIHNLFTN